MRKDKHSEIEPSSPKNDKSRQEMNVTSKITPKLFVSGRLDRKKQTYSAKSLILLTTLENDIKTYCRGGELAVLNYLIKEGLKNVKESGAPIHIDIADLESDI
jgi:hypothetical protein